ncbi:thiol-disulfide isomerase/thioredoxin [Pedobacter cryoconitis]|uniref:Thiol-disulfide isomerase/thioredoxin n=1 Tax=Pedobacter cryoconitis TaxID=188932 RepID=A0A7W8YRZ1_9SPHI|nr:TlpA disulfide reductase family protein [Pedobacter cryoconitis]MBB5620731.1 thiol-disulfide isomerase/thioredoxin [Pedobacter cryoconitis]
MRNKYQRGKAIRIDKKNILTIVLCLMSLFSYSQSHSAKQFKLLVNLRNAPFNSLALLDYRERNNVIIKGNQVDQFKWEFIIPDSIMENSKNMLTLFVPQKDTVANAYRQVRFISEFKNEKTVIATIGIPDNTTYIEGDYIGNTRFENENVASNMGRTDSIIIGNLICDDFKVSINNDSSDLKVRSIDPYYAWFDGGGSKLSYDENLLFYIKLAEQYPDSRYLMSYLSQNLSKFKTRQDVRKIYEKFSEKQKNTKWSARIESFLSDNFYNISLINLNSKKIEPLVQDSSKYNLVVFIASWCGPCKEEIPLLKELYKNLKTRFNFTYVSMDYEKRVKAFQDILIKNDIPWRTLYAYKDLQRVGDLFSIKSIPLSLLFYPDGHMEVMDVRNKENQKKLYNLK